MARTTGSRSSLDRLLGSRPCEEVRNKVGDDQDEEEELTVGLDS